ncbi:hypothetical protein [Moellerella wisconsensis]|uniref:hypothetical protein n=1 Tax=Moellerella wisconsensis TaxID=158849 RepID=UPI001F4EC3C6|nr:hypothetical protein [Moellerella wisconsensis]UNH23494.1 hypothetical protein MNY68_11795 [Moellerella wisconsensis]
MKTSEKSNYIISLTSYYKRLNTLHLVIESLLQQSNPAKNIYLWLSSEDIKLNNGIPDKILSLKSRGLIIIIKNENIKSFKKLSYIREVTDNKIKYIITADDDIFYPSYWANELIKTSNKYTCISCFRGHNFIINNNKYDYMKAMKNNISFDSPSFNLIPTGCSGIAYPINSISSMVSDFNLINKLSPNTDDIWYKAMTLKNNYKCCRVNKENIHFPVVLQSLNDSLFSTNVHNFKNSENLEKTISYFNLEKFFLSK